MELYRDAYPDYETNRPKIQYIAHRIYMNIHLSRWLLILALQGMSFCLTETSAQVVSWSFSPAQLLYYPRESKWIVLYLAGDLAPIARE